MTRLALLILTLGAWSFLRAESPPNILWITVEDMSPNLGCYGDATARTPNLDRFARQSVRYPHAFATAPVCSPSRACLITGLYATSLGNPHLRCQIRIPDRFRAYSAHLREAGYFCANNVKTDYNLAEEKKFIADAWDRCDAQAHWRQRREDQPFFAIFNLMETHQSRTSVWPWDEFEALAAQWLSAQERTDPASVTLPPYYPDTPLARRTLARYYDCIQIMDRRMGQILRELEQDGLAEETVVFFYSDHGTGLPRGKRLLHDSGMQVPLLVRFPVRHAGWAPAAAGQTVDRMVSFVDFPPTVLSLAGVTIPPQMQGVPFLGEAAGRPLRLVYGARDRVDEAFETSRSVRDRRWLYIRNYTPHLSWNQPEGYSDQSEFRREIARLARQGQLNPTQLTYAAPTKPREELYDTKKDPHQVHNLAGSWYHQPRLRKMRSALREWIVATRDLGFIPEQQLSESLGEGIPFLWAQEEHRYPIRRILQAAELVGRPKAVPELMGLLQASDPSVRYWAAVGLRAAGPLSEPARDALVKALQDPSWSVRIEAAGALAASGREPDQVWTVLTNALRSRQLHAALHAARTLQLLEEKAQPALTAMQERLDTVDQIRDADKALQITFALQPAVEALARKP